MGCAIMLMVDDNLDSNNTPKIAIHIFSKLQFSLVALGLK
jgi:hypothetical protein